MFSSLLALIPPSYIYPSLLWLSPARPAWVVSVRSASSLTHVHVSSWTFVVDFLSWTFCRGPFVVDLLSWVCALGGLGVCVGWPYVGWPGCVRWVARAPCPVFCNHYLAGTRYQVALILIYCIYSKCYRYLLPVEPHNYYMARIPYTACYRYTVPVPVASG